MSLFTNGVKSAAGEPNPARDSLKCGPRRALKLVLKCGPQVDCMRPVRGWRAGAAGRVRARKAASQQGRKKGRQYKTSIPPNSMIGRFTAVLGTAFLG